MEALIAPLRAAAGDAVSAVKTRILIAALTWLAAALGFGFALAALWSAIAAIQGPAIASLALALMFLGLALALNLVQRRATRRRREAAARAAAEKRPPPPLEEAFLAGLRIGRSLGR